VEQKKSVIVIGAGMAGLATARQLHAFGYKVTVLEARNRVGGRCNTDSSLQGITVDLGASIVTGLEGNPLTIVCKQLGTKLHALGYECPIYDIDGNKIDPELDTFTERKFNDIMDIAAEKKDNLPPSLGKKTSH
jgi:lysine-specific histone demethylase 1B